MKTIKQIIAASTVALTSALSVLPAHATLGSCSEAIVLGTTISETGPFSTLADRWRKMTEVFAEEVNKGGGVSVKSCNKKLPIKFVIYDDQSVPATAVALFEKMATVDKVDFFVGPDWSSLGGPVPPVAEKHKIPMVMANVATPSVYDRGLKYIWGTPFPVVPNWSARYFEMIGKVSPKPQTIFFITHDNPVMKGITATWSKKAEEQGLKVLGNETFSPELKDFTALIAKVRAAKADIIYLSSYDNASVPLVQQMRQLKVRAMDVHHTMLTGALHRQVGKDIEGMTGELSWYPGVKGDYSDLVETVMKRADVSMFDYIWTLGRLTSYLTMIQAIEKAGVVDREKVKEALFKATVKSPAGDVTFDERGFPNTGAFTVQMNGGKVNVVWPPEVATGKLVWPSPTWK
ncbi:amino acid ABC transporter substrate-binding protein [Rhodoferax sp. BAB1]|uniref:amino acid ABC transporter substrate-binding protein n=1 Tax=Rhodoferax sp. BAB1 TaxID=2741720 RepID=UPI00157744DE|nr:amino acid ABC transporter substrate-binding protein [Rhodoferax sp. BAB1]QKO20964.1 amino acid ABC transporter substrate-binding protein [Rhodoferax sp. BAB1]